MTEPQAPKVDVTTWLAIERTRVAYDRTMLAWIRTATSLITFGFAINKYFEIQGVATPSDRLIGPRKFSLILICLGLFSLALALWQTGKVFSECVRFILKLLIRWPGWSPSWSRFLDFWP